MSGKNEFGFENPRSDFGLFFGEIINVSPSKIRC